MKHKLPLFLIFFLLFAAEVGWGYYAAHRMDYIHGDAISRVANAFYVLYSRDPHLGAIGFVWNPLPSLLELIPLLFWRWAPAVAASGLAAVIVSAAFAAGTATMLYHRLRSQEMPWPFALLMTAAFALNPFIFIYGANGMSEMMFAFFLVWCVFALTDWMTKNDTGSLIQLGIALAGGFWVRYESVAFGFAVALGLAAALYAARHRFETNARIRDGLVSRIEAVWFTVLTPAVFSGLIWILLNSLIMGDPLFFLRSGYSNTAFVQDRSQELVAMSNDFLNVLTFVLRKSAYFSLPLLAIALVRLLSGRLWRWDMFILLCLAGSIPAMQAVMLYQGSSYGWLRFFLYPMIIAVAWYAYEWSHIRRGNLRTLHLGILCAGLLASSLIWRDMNNLAFAPEEYGGLHMEESSTAANMRLSRSVAAFIDDYEGISDAPGELVLTDSFSAFNVLVNSRYPKQYVITNDRNFHEALTAPRENGIGYILVSKLEGAVLQVLHTQYPELFDGGYDWAELIRDFEGEFRLYRIKPMEEGSE